MDNQPSRRHPLLILLLAHQLVGRRRELPSSEAEGLLSGTSSLKHPGQVGVHIEAQETRRGDDPEQDRPAVPTLRTAREERVEAEAGVILECTLAGVVVDGDGGIVDEARETFPVVEAVPDHLAQGIGEQEAL